jgi:hypothetical protein
MEKETIRIIAIHPVNGVQIKKIEFTSEDEEFLGDIQGFDSFREYVDYYINVEIDTFEQGGYTVISAKEEEVKDIINELSK